MEAIKKIKELIENANKIYDLFHRKIPKWIEDPKHYDKTGFGFNLDDRYNCSKFVTIHFDSWCGIYGNSSCNSELSVNDELFKKHLLKFMNKNKRDIMMNIAESIMDEARDLRLNAEKELESQSKLLKELGDNASEDSTN